jgi:YidC/Oxa1 family membrane protein insertase
VKIFEPLYDGVSWIILTLHRGFDHLGMNEDWSWCLAIVGLVVLIRIALIPLFVKQIRSMRNMQVLQPKIRAIQERYKGDREKTSQELMKLYKEHNTNPLSSCFPVLAQSPFFLALFRVLNGIAKGHQVGVLTQHDVDSARRATFFGASLSDKFIGANTTHVQIVTILMIIAMSASQFYTQRQLMTKNMPGPVAGAPSNPFMQQQKLMMYLFPIMFGVFGINFPVGVLLYWLVSNFWSMGQQLYVIRRMPAVGSPAYEAMMKRKEKQEPGPGAAAIGKVGGTPAGGGSNGAAPDGGGDASGGGTKTARQQPQRQTRSQRGPKKR